MKFHILPLQQRCSKIISSVGLNVLLVHIIIVPASKPSSKSASKVAVNNQDAPMGSALKRLPRHSKTKAAKAARTASSKTNTPASSDYAKLVASSEAIAASIRYKSKMEMLMG
jgi:hypothetical protein